MKTAMNQLRSAQCSGGGNAKIAVVDEQVGRLWKQLRIFGQWEKRTKWERGSRLAVYQAVALSDHVGQVTVVRNIFSVIDGRSKAMTGLCTFTASERLSKQVNGPRVKAET